MWVFIDNNYRVAGSIKRQASKFYYYYDVVGERGSLGGAATHTHKNTLEIYLLCAYIEYTRIGIRARIYICVCFICGSCFGSSPRWTSSVFYFIFYHHRSVRPLRQQISYLLRTLYLLKSYSENERMLRGSVELPVFEIVNSFIFHISIHKIKE